MCERVWELGGGCERHLGDMCAYNVCMRVCLYIRVLYIRAFVVYTSVCCRCARLFVYTRVCLYIRAFVFICSPGSSLCGTPLALLGVPQSGIARGAILGTGRGNERGHHPRRGPPRSSFPTVQKTTTHNFDLWCRNMYACMCTHKWTVYVRRAPCGRRVSRRCSIMCFISCASSAAHPHQHCSSALLISSAHQLCSSALLISSAHQLCSSGASSSASHPHQHCSSVLLIPTEEAGRSVPPS